MDAKRSDNKRARVLAAGESVFLKQGYARTTMGDLAAAAGMSRPALYLVYARKHELFSSIIRDESRYDRVERSTHSETDSLPHWMTWVCDLWLGENAEAEGCARPIALPLHQRSESSPREVAFLQSVLQEGLGKRLPGTADESVCISVARLLTFCVCGLLDARVGGVERQALLAVQIDALADAALRPEEPESTIRARSMPSRAKKSHATARAIAVR